MKTLLRVRILLCAAVFLSALAAPVARALEPDPAYTALRAARPEGKGLAVTNLTLQRDVFEFQFTSGAFQPLAAVDGRIAGAVFAGQGTMKLSPASDAERRHLALAANEPGLQALSEQFESLVLLFTDGTLEEIEKGSTAGAAPPNAAAVFEDFIQKQRKILKRNLQLRLLRDLPRKADPSDGVFLAFVPGKKYSQTLAVVDPSGLDWLAPGLGGETSLLTTVETEPSLWYSSASKSLVAGSAAGERRLTRAEHYTIETEIQSNSEIRGVATIRFQPVSASLRVLPLHLLGKLRIREASFASAESGPWTPAAVVQEAEKEDTDAALVFPSPLRPGEKAWVKISYNGKDVLHPAGDGNFAVEARESWYPNLGTFVELATFDLTFHCPKAYDVVAVGNPVENRVEGASRVSRWEAKHPIRVAGFNYGKFRKLERADKDSGVKVEVYTNPGTPDIVQEINDLLRVRSGQTGAGLSSGPGSPLDREGAQVGLSSLHVDTETLADSAMADGINTARVCSRYFGPLPEGRLAITQQTQWSFGQSWPSLVFLPYLAALDGTTRRELGLKNTGDFVELVGPHEVSHQWWGHLVGWQSYRDQWLSEGLAEFSASLVLEATGGVKRFHDFWEKTRKFVTFKPPQSQLANDQAGPMTQGWRLASKRSPGAYQAMVYAKGAYVIHMLRLTMREAGPNPDANFMAMMKDFVTSWAGKNPSTRDFQTVVERHMVPNMNGTADGKMDWFFRQWVYGTEIPRYKEKLEVVKAGEGQYKITGTIAQEGVSADFRALTHLYLDYGKGETAHLGVLPMIGSSTRNVDVTVKLPKAPKRAFLNAYHEVLSRD